MFWQAGSASISFGGLVHDVRDAGSRGHDWRVQYRIMFCHNESCEKNTKQYCILRQVAFVPNYKRTLLRLRQSKLELWNSDLTPNLSKVLSLRGIWLLQNIIVSRIIPLLISALTSQSQWHSFLLSVFDCYARFFSYVPDCFMTHHSFQWSRMLQFCATSPLKQMKTDTACQNMLTTFVIVSWSQINWDFPSCNSLRRSSWSPIVRPVMMASVRELPAIVQSLTDKCIVLAILMTFVWVKATATHDKTSHDTAFFWVESTPTDFNFPMY